MQKKSNWGFSLKKKLTIVLSGFWIVACGKDSNDSAKQKSQDSQTLLLSSEVDPDMDALEIEKTLELTHQSLNSKTSDRIKIQLKQNRNDLSLTSGQLDSTSLKKHQNIEYSLDGLPFCLLDARVSLLEDHSILILGKQPALSSPDILSKENLPEFDAKEEVESFLLSQLPIRPEIQDFNREVQSVSVMETNRCYFNPSSTQQVEFQQEIFAAYKVHVLINDLPYQIISTKDQILVLQKSFLKAVGTAQIYEQNPTTQRKIEVQTDKLADTGYLETDLFETIMVEGERIKRDDFNFTVESDDDLNQGEVHLFFNLLSQYEFFENLGFQWWGPKRLEIHVHAMPGGSVNNGLYLPGDQPGVPNPRVMMGDGDGSVLTNLALDSDAVSHEISHHIVFRTLKNTVGESLVLHEGIADYFVFAETGDTCLGESICGPNSTGLCYVERQCLRTATNTLKFGTSDFTNLIPGSPYTHQHGQLISGFLWDVRSDANSDPQEIDQLVFRSIDFYPSRAGYLDFLISLFKADKEKESKYFALLEAKALERGFDSFMSTVKQALENFDPNDGSETGTQTGPTTNENTASDTSNGNQENPVVTATEENAGTQTGEIKPKDSKEDFPGGCSVGSNRSFDSLFLLLLLLSFLPKLNFPKNSNS